MEFASAITVIDSFLHDRIGHTGASGFEGLIATLLQEATGQEFRLSSSGRQSGRDMSSESGYGNVIKVEAKHYLEKTPLNLRQLISEIDEAAESDRNLDIWALATSRSVDDQIQSKLDEHAGNYGIEVVLLDLGVNEIPRIGVLMAGHPDTVLGWASRHEVKCEVSELRTALAVIANAGDFVSARNRLTTKLASLVGYESARRRAHSRLLEIVGNFYHAQSEFCQPLAVREPTAQVIERQVNNRFDDWWEGDGFPMPAVILGEEGMGKTWALFDWLVRQIERSDMPIILPFAAVAQELHPSEGPDRLVASLLARWTGVLDAQRWGRRLARWLDSTSGRPLLLLVVDGLNERADMNWRPFFTALMAPPWYHKVAVVATDRPSHWKNRCARAGLATFHEIEIGGFLPPELNRALSISQISYADIPQELLPLISIPRYCRLVVQHYQEMIAAADFTRERLIYLEVKNRQESKLQYPLTDQRLFEIIRDLAEHARTNRELRPEDLRSLIGIPGGNEANIYEEIISGGLLVLTNPGAMIPIYRVEAIRMVYGFGMLLAQELIDGKFTGDDLVEEFLNSWFEPQRDMDRKVEICGSALFHALFRQDFPKSTLRGLVHYWLGLRNWATTAQSGFTMYVRRCPDVFIDIAEGFWSTTGDAGAAQAFLGNAFGANRDDPAVQPVLKLAIQRWMGMIHPLGRSPWQFDPAGYEQTLRNLRITDDQKVDFRSKRIATGKRIKDEIEARAGCPVVPGPIEVCGLGLTVVSDASLLRLARFGLMLISYGDPTPFILSIVHWAVASAVMDDSGFSDLVSWVIRLSDRDVERDLLAKTRGLLARSEPTARAAARILLLVIGNIDSETLIDEHNLTPEWYVARRREHAQDPCTSMYGWTEAEAIPCLGRQDVHLRTILSRAALAVIDLSISIPSSLIQRAMKSLELIKPALIRAGSGRTIEESDLELLSPLLCVHAPGKLCGFMRSVVRTMPERDLNGQYFLAIQLPEISLLLTTDEVTTISRAITSLAGDASEWRADDWTGPRHLRKVAEARAFSGLAPHLGSSGFFERFISRSVNAMDLDGFEPWFASVSQEDADQAITLLHSSPNDVTLVRLLWAFPHIGITLSESDREKLVELASCRDEKVRAAAIRVAVVSGDEDLGCSIINLGRTAAMAANPWEEHWLAFLLAKFGTHLSLEELAQRVRPYAMDVLIEERGNQPDEIGLYASCIDTEWRRIVSAGHPDVELLPEIEIRTDPTGGRVPFPKFHRPARARTIRLDRSTSSWTSGPPLDPFSDLREMLRTDVEEIAREANQERRRQVDSILAAWRTDAFQWYGRQFSAQVLNSLYDMSPALVEQWIRPALDDSPYSTEIRSRLGSILEPICRVLLQRNPKLGLDLWKALRNRGDSPIAIDTIDIAFCAPCGPEVDSARAIVLNECWDDAAIARVAFSCGRWRRTAWLNSVIANLVSAERLWQKAKGLTLASFSDISISEFDDLIMKAMVRRSWVEENISPLKEDVRKNALARHWYGTFLSAEGVDTSWGALKVALLLADERLFNWRAELERDCPQERARARIRFFNLGWGSGRKLFDEISRENDRKGRLFGIKIQPGEIFPFMETHTVV